MKKFAKFGISLGIAIFITFLIVLVYFVVPDYADFGPQKYQKSFETASENWRYVVKSVLSGNYSKADYSAKDRGAFNSLVIAAIDDSSLKSEGGWPFNRKVYADMMDRFASYPAGEWPTVFFDIIFAEGSAHPESDKAFLDAMKKYPGLFGEDIIFDLFNTEISALEFKENREFIIKKMTEEGANYFSPGIQALKRFEIVDSPYLDILTPFPKVVPMMKDYADVMHFSGSANVDLSENTITKIPMIVKSYYYYIEGKETNLTTICYPSIILAMAVKEMKAEVSNITVRPGMITIRNAEYKGKKLDFEIPVDEKFRLKINFKSAPGTGYIRTIPFDKLNAVKLAKGSTVFVGMYSKLGAYDIKQSPFGLMYGIELNAYAFGTLMNRDFLVEVSQNTNIIYLLIFSIVIGLLVSFGTQYAVAAGILALIIPLSVGFGFFQNGRVIVTFLALLNGILVLISVQIFMLLTEDKEKRFIKSTFSSYLNPKLVDILIQSPEMIQLGGEEKEVTVFFSAVKNLGEVTENCSPKEFVEFLNRYFSRMADIVVNTSGTLDKYIGDSVMAFWGAPVDLPEHALKACEAAVRMMEVVEEFNQAEAEKGYKPIQVHIGINTGSIVVGNVGSEQQKNYTAIGDSVNLASRLKGLNKYFHTHIVISEYTYEKVKEHVIARELDLTRVKGKTKPVRIYELMDIVKNS